MGLSKDLLDKLACPQCVGPLAYREEANCLVCEKCKLEFKVVDNVPVLLVEEARKL